MRAFDLDKNRTLAAICDASEASHEGVLWLKPDGQILAANTELIKMLGYTASDALPTSVFEVNPTMSFLAWKKLWKKVAAQQKMAMDSELLTKEESIISVKIHGVLMQVDNQELMLMTAQNIAESKRYEELYRLTSRIAGIGSWEWNLVNNEFLFNEEMFALLNIAPKTELSKTTLSQFIAKGLSEKEFNKFSEQLKNAIKSGTQFEYEFSFELDGEFKNFNLHAHPVTLEDQTIKFYGTLQNVDNISKRTDDMYFTKFCMDYARDMIYWVSPDGLIKYVNQMVCQTMGYTAEELIEKPIQFIDHQFKLSNEVFWQQLKDKKSIDFESVNVTKSGKEIPVSVVTNFISFRGKEFNCAFVRDLSRKKERDEILNLSKITLDNDTNPIYWTNEQGGLKYFNPAFVSRIGYTEEEISQMKVSDFVHEGSENDFQDEWLQLKKVGHLDYIRKQMITKNGEIFPVELYISMIEVDGEHFCTTSLRDITEREQLWKLAKLSKHTLDKSLDLIFWLYEDGSFRYFNQSFTNKTGYTNEEINQLKVFDFINDMTIEDFKSECLKLKPGSKIVDTDKILKLKSGALIPCEMIQSKVQFENEEFIVIVLRDITERKLKEEEISLQMDEISRLQEATEAENLELKEEIDLEFNFSNIITRDPNYKRVLRQIEQVADTDATVLILGETGTGKELLARAIHQMSARADLPMIKVNCGALPENLIESELFGHEKGAFTGAHQRKIGKFERADKGTIFLDEMGELPLDMQAKLLRILQEGELERIGGNKLLNVDVRIIAATNRNLEEEVQNGKFREDLFYRLNVFPIYNIPLRERREDIPVLINYFAQKYAKKINKEISEISPVSMNKLMAYDFLGNVRELQNLVERAVILAKGKVLKIDIALSSKTNNNVASKFKTMEEMQKYHIIEALKRTNGKVSGKNSAAALLGMNDKTLASRMKKLGIDKKGYF